MYSLKLDRIAFLSLFLLCFITNANADNSKIKSEKFPFNYGKMEDTVYANPFFGFKMSVPSAWVVQNKSQIAYVISKGKDAVEFKEETTNKAIKDLDVSSMTLIMLSKHELGAPVEFNPSLMIMAEDVSMYPGVKIGSDYLFQLKRQFKNSNLNFTVSEEYGNTELSGNKFDILECSKEGTNTHLDYICSIQKRFAFAFIITYSNEDEKNELMDIVRTTQLQQ